MYFSCLFVATFCLREFVGKGWALRSLRTGSGFAALARSCFRASFTGPGANKAAVWGPHILQFYLNCSYLGVQ